jgi:hypothetical protein
MSIKPLMDTSAVISGNNDPAEVPTRVGGHPLTLTSQPQRRRSIGPLPRRGRLA